MPDTTERSKGDNPVRAMTGSGLLVDLLERIGQSDEHVVVFGPPAFEKEPVARFIHANSPRRPFPFVIYAPRLTNESLPRAVPPSTGLGLERALAAANGGTLFLAELFELSDPDQASLLRAIETHGQHRAGARRRPVRVIAATRRDFPDAARDTTLRSSLFHRLNVMSVRVPEPHEHGPARGPQLLTFKEEKLRLLETWEPEYLRELLCHVNGNVSVAAKTAGIARAHMYRLLKKHGLTR